MSMLKHVLALFAFLMISFTQVCAVESWKCLGISGCKKDKTGRGYSLQALSGKQTNDKLTSETSSILLFFGTCLSERNDDANITNCTTPNWINTPIPVSSPVNA